MEVLHRKGVALLLCVLMIMCSSTVGAGASLRQLRHQAEDVFLLGKDKSGATGISYGLRELDAQGYNMTVVALRYLDNEDKAIAEISERREALENAGSPKEKYRTAQELTTCVITLAEILETKELNSEDKTLMRKNLVNMENTLYLLASNDYNSSAANFNRRLNTFPSNIMGPITGVHPLELYE